MLNIWFVVELSLIIAYSIIIEALV